MSGCAEFAIAVREHRKAALDLGANRMLTNFEKIGDLLETDQLIALLPLLEIGEPRAQRAFAGGKASANQERRQSMRIDQVPSLPQAHVQKASNAFESEKKIAVVVIHTSHAEHFNWLSLNDIVKR